MEKGLNRLVEKLKAAAGANLRAVALYGSAATGEFQPKYSDLNVLCVVDRLDAADLENLNPVTAWWAQQGQQPPMVFTLDALRRSGDVFPIELLDIKASHRVLYGEDVFAALDVPMEAHRLELERELRTNLLRLRQRYLAWPHKPRTVLALMMESISTFAALFRHALVALGQAGPASKRDAIDRLAVLLGLDAGVFHTILDVREGKQAGRNLDVRTTFRTYLAGVTRVIEEVDRRLAQGK